MATGDPQTQRLEAVVLAAGAGARFGGGKLLAPWGEGVLLDAALAPAFAAPVRCVTVVTGADGPAVGAAASAFAARHGQGARLRLVHAPDHAEGMGASLRAGVASLPGDAEGAFVFLGDMPRVPTAVLRPMAEALRSGSQAAAPEFQGRRGNPVALARGLFPAVLALRGDEGARRILGGLGEHLALIEAPDDGVLFDVDERSQLRP